MSIEETQRLLQTFRIVPNKLLGQNFMVEPAFFPKLVDYAELVFSDVVLDVGAGFGFLSKFLVSKCSSVIAVEKDPQIAFVLRQQTSAFDKISVVEGDVLTSFLPFFNKVIAAPPYYLSSKLVLFLLEHDINCAVLVVQRDFANRLVAKIGSEDYSWLTVTVYQKAHLELLDFVSKKMFYPSPEVDSVILRIKPRKNSAFTVNNPLLFKQMVKWLFTERNKKISNAIVPFIRNFLKLDKKTSQDIVQKLPYREMRPRELTPENFGDLANAFTN